MLTINRAFLLVAVFLCPLIGYGVDEPHNKSKPDLGLPPGTYGGCDQKMEIGHEGVVSYKDRPHLTQIRIEPDSSLVATFPTEAGSNEEIHLQASDPEHARAVWTAGAEGRIYKATATPHSEETYSFRLEVRRDGKLVAGSQVFCAICKPRVHLRK
jgi:hypothetical protein